MIEGAKNLMMHAGTLWILWLLIGLSVMTLSIAIDRAWALRRRGAELGSAVAELHRLLREHRLDDARALLRKSASVEALVAAAGLAEWASGPRAAAEAMSAARGVERARMETRLGFLGTVGSNAPFVGLLGTVIGVVEAFDQLGRAGAESSAMAPEAVMAAIAEALVATAVGLVVAIPAVALFNYFQGRIAAALDRSETLGHVVLTHLEGAKGEAPARASSPTLTTEAA